MNPILGIWKSKKHEFIKVDLIFLDFIEERQTYLNKRPIGYIAHPRNQFKSMNTFERSYDIIYYKTGPVVQEVWKYLSNFVIISQCKKVWSFHLNKLKSSLPKDAFC